MICSLVQIMLAATNFLINRVSKLLLSRELQNENYNDGWNKAMNKVLFYGGNDYENIKKTGLSNLLCIFYVLLQSKLTVDVCVPTLCSEALVNCLVEVQRQNKVRIRIIIHNSRDLRYLQLFTQNRMEVKLIKSEIRLEHEFIVIDSSEPELAHVLFGNVCCGWCSDKIESFNRAPTLLASEKTLVTALKHEFDRIWNLEI